MSLVAAPRAGAPPSSRATWRAATRGTTRGATLAWPMILLGPFMVVPFLLMVLVSLSTGPGGTISLPTLSLRAYEAAVSPDYLRLVIYSCALAAMVGAASVAVAFPFTCFLSQLGRRQQTGWLIFLLSTLSLSEVLVVFSWQIMLSRRAGLSNMLVLLGMLRRPENWTPGFGGVLVCLVYLVLPFSVLALYPAISTLDPELAEAAGTLGASPRRTLLSVTIPNLLRPIVSSFAIAAVMSLGAYVTPLVLGRPNHWTSAVRIANTALGEGNFHTASAMALVLLAFTSLLLLGLSAAGRLRRRQR